MQNDRVNTPIIGCGMVFDDQDKQGRDKISFYLIPENIEKLKEAIALSEEHSQDEGRVKVSLTRFEEDGRNKGFMVVNPGFKSQNRGANRGPGKYVPRTRGSYSGKQLNKRVD